MNLFDLEVYEKKKAVPSARKKKNGSKKKSCKLSTDYLTEKQLQKRNGEIMTYRLNSPMQWQEFKAMPPDIQARYLGGLVDKFDVNAHQLGTMFGVSGQSVVNIMARNKLSVALNKKPMDKDKKDQFMAFVRNGGVEKTTAENTNETLEKPEEPIKATPMKTETTEEPAHEMEMETNNFHMSNFNINMNGKFNKETFFKSITTLIPDGTEVEMEIRCTFKQKEV